MKRQQSEFLFGVLENAPTLLFLAIWKGGADLEIAGWSGCISAAAVLLLFICLRRPFDTIVLGININFLLTAPAIVGVHALGLTDLARAGIHYAASGAVATVFLVGAIQTVTSSRGFIGSDLAPGERRRQSLLLLALAGLTVPWSILHAGDTWVSVVGPLIVLFAARRFLLARLADKDSGPPLAAAAIIPDGGAEAA